MKTFRFKDFQVYKDAKKLRRTVLKLLQKFPSEEKYRLVDQIHRSCLSIILNIAEGSSKTSDTNFNRYLGNSLGSVNEIAAALEVAHSVELISREQFEKGCTLYESIANQLGGFSKHLKSNS